MADFPHLQQAEATQRTHQQGGQGEPGEQARADGQTAQQGPTEAGATQSSDQSFHGMNLKNQLFMGL
jgi:hypothetical protein